MNNKIKSFLLFDGILACFILGLISTGNPVFYYSILLFLSGLLLIQIVILVALYVARGIQQDFIETSTPEDSIFLVLSQISYPIYANLLVYYHWDIPAIFFGVSILMRMLISEKVKKFNETKR